MTGKEDDNSTARLRDYGERCQYLEKDYTRIHVAELLFDVPVRGTQSTVRVRVCRAHLELLRLAYSPRLSHRARSVPCPDCGAVPGASCTSRTGRGTTAHASRKDVVVLTSLDQY